MLQFVKRPAFHRVFFAFAALLVAGTAAAPAKADWYYHHGYYHHGYYHHWHPYWGPTYYGPAYYGPSYYGPGYYSPGYVAAPGVYIGVR